MNDVEDDAKLIAGINLRAELRSIHKMASLLEEDPDCALYAMVLRDMASSVYARVAKFGVGHA